MDGTGWDWTRDDERTMVLPTIRYGVDDKGDGSKRDIPIGL